MARSTAATYCFFRLPLRPRDMPILGSRGTPGRVRAGLLTGMITSFHIGQSHGIEAAIGIADVARFVALSGDAAPLHTDMAFAKAAGFEGPLVHGAYLVALVSRL